MGTILGWVAKVVGTLLLRKSHGFNRYYPSRIP